MNINIWNSWSQKSRISWLLRSTRMMIVKTWWRFFSTFFNLYLDSTITWMRIWERHISRKLRRSKTRILKILTWHKCLLSQLYSILRTWLTSHRGNSWRNCVNAACELVLLSVCRPILWITWEYLRQTRRPSRACGSPKAFPTSSS